MALIKCKECNHQISSQAKTCPNCGCQTKDIDSNPIGSDDLATLQLTRSLGSFE